LPSMFAMSRDLSAFTPKRSAIFYVTDASQASVLAGVGV
jgi:hypothetical protein